MNEKILNIMQNIMHSIYTEDKEALRKASEELYSSIKTIKIDDENKFEQFQLLVLLYCCYLCLGLDCKKIQSEITQCITYFNQISEYKEKFQRYCSKEAEGNIILEMNAFKQLVRTGTCEDKDHYAFALYSLAHLVLDRIENNIFNLDSALWGLVSFTAGYAQSKELLESLISDVCVGYFYAYCEQDSISKRYFYTDREVIESHLRNLSKRDPESYEAITQKICFNELRSWVHFYCLFERTERSKALRDLFEKSFLNISQIIESSDKENDEIDYVNSIMGKKNRFLKNYTDDAYESPLYLFDRVRETINDIKKYPGYVVMLYMLVKEFSLEQFYICFPDRKDTVFQELESYEWNLIPDVLAIRNANKGSDRKVDELFSLYERDLLCIYSKKSEEFNIVQTKELTRYKNNIDLLYMLLFFCVWENVSYAMKDNLYGDHLEANKTQRLIIPFFNACQDGSWNDRKSFSDLLQNVAEIFCFNDCKDCFKDFSIKTDESNFALINLLYNLSRTEDEAQRALKDQINYLRELQRQKLPVERKKDCIEKAKENQKKLCCIDKGFKLKDFITQVYPFCDSSFSEYFGDMTTFMLHRDYDCKFVCETDTEYKNENETETDFRKTNEKGFTTRYLYKDRNMSVHYVKHSTVDTLLKPANWRTLLYAFCDSEKHLLNLLALTESNYYAHPMDYPKPQKNPSVFILYYLIKENKRLYNEFIQKLYKTAGVSSFEPEYKLYVFDEQKNSFRDNSENIIKTIESKFDLTDEKSKKKSSDEFGRRLSYLPETLNCRPDDPAQKRENLFIVRLEKILNIMFAVNGSNENGLEHNLTMYDFFRRYHAEIAVYLIYLTGEFTKL